MTKTDRQRTERWLEQISELDPASLGEWRAGKVCQMCGAIATVGGWEEWVAAHHTGGEFIALGGRHGRCSEVPTGGFAGRPYRFCEICQESVLSQTERRFSLSWLCEPCETSIRRTGHSLEQVLHELGRLRFDHYEAHPARAPKPDEGGIMDGVGERVSAPTGWLPPGLFQCEECETIRGTTWCVRSDGSVGGCKSTCLCEGILCQVCGERRSRRPISDYYNPNDGHFRHVPYFMVRTVCSECRSG